MTVSFDRICKWFTYIFPLGSFPLSEVSLLTDEERERFLPVIRTFTSVLKKDIIDHEEIKLLVRQSEELQKFVPEEWKDLICASLESTFGKNNYECDRAPVISVLAPIKEVVNSLETDEAEVPENDV